MSPKNKGKERSFLQKRKRSWERLFLNRSPLEDPLNMLYNVSFDTLYKLSMSFEMYSIFLKIIFRGKYSKNDTDKNDAQM